MDLNSAKFELNSPPRISWSNLLVEAAVLVSAALGLLILLAL